MGARSDFRDNLRSIVDRPDQSDFVVDMWIQFAEERINSELLHKDMIRRVQIPFVDPCRVLPDDWIQFSYLRYVVNQASNDPNVRSGRTFRYYSEPEFFDNQGRVEMINQPGVPAYSNYFAYSMRPMYTIVGNTVFISPSPDSVAGTPIEIAYFAKLHPLADDNTSDTVLNPDGSNWLYQKELRLYTYASLSASAPVLQEDERFQLWETLATDRIDKLNLASDRAKHSGSPLRAKLRAF